MVNYLYEGLLWDRQCFYNGLACKKRICFGHVIDPLLTNPLRSIWLNVGPGCFFSSSSSFVLFCFFVSFFFFAFLWNEIDLIRGP